MLNSESVWGVKQGFRVCWSVQAGYPAHVVTHLRHVLFGLHANSKSANMFCFADTAGWLFLQVCNQDQTPVSFDGGMLNHFWHCAYPAFLADPLCCTSRSLSCSANFSSADMSGCDLCAIDDRWHYECQVLLSSDHQLFLQPLTTICMPCSDRHVLCLPI
jgi:hypothetical protein